MTLEQYIKRRDNGQSLVEIQKEKLLSESTVWTLELGYQCYLRKLPLDKAVSFIENLTVIDPTQLKK
ncbi:hypothetical protein ABC382_00050 [Lysinibacillus sp. 1P01SD]|uniref:hypothetical protein n=1 Tax=Lysinibacillus sp. 1P01SD TaxID=3132285 RepID=UPI0039A1F738